MPTHFLLSRYSAARVEVKLGLGFIFTRGVRKYFARNLFILNQKKRSIYLSTLSKGKADQISGV